MAINCIWKRSIWHFMLFNNMWQRVFSSKKLLNWRNSNTSSNTSSKLSVYYQNTSGLHGKSKDLHLKYASLNYDVIIFTETCLTETHLSSEIFANNSYAGYGKDRSCSLKHLSRGGGVIIAVQAELSSYLLPLTDESCIDII